MKRGKSRKAQVAVFIIIAVLLLVVVAIIFLVQQPVKEKTQIPLEVVPVHDFVLGCLEETAKQAILKAGENGGRFLNSTAPTTAIYLYDGEDYTPTKSEIEKEISEYIETQAPLCIDNFNDFSDFSIDESRMDVKTSITDDNVLFDVSYLLKITKGENTYQIESFESEVPVRFGITYFIVYDTIQEQKSHPDSLCLSCLGDLSEENDIEVEIQDLSDEITLIKIIDKKSIINQQNFTYNFAMQW